MACAKKNPRGIGSTILHEYGHALDYAIGVKLGHGKEISEVIGLGKSIRSELKGNLFKEAEDYFKTHPELAKDFYDDDQRLSAYAYEKFSGELLPTKSRQFSYPKLPDVKHLIFDKRNDHDREPLSDIISGATKNGSNLGYFHTKSYWSLRSEGWKGFTEIGTLSESGFGIKFLETYLPKSHILWKKAIKDGADAAVQ